MFSHEFHAVAEINPEKGAESITGELTLLPSATLAGRVVDPDGNPLADLPIYAMTMEPLADPSKRAKFNVTAGSFPRGPRTDKEGKFRIEGLAPGLNYRLAVARQMFVLEPDGAKGVTL